RNHDAVAGENERTFSGMEEFDGAIEFGFVDAGANTLGWQFGLGGAPIEFGGGLLGVLGDIHENRARAARLGDDKSFANSASDIFDFGDDHIVFGDGHGDAGDVNFLKGVGTEQLAANLAGDADDGRGIEHRGGD